MQVRGPYFAGEQFFRRFQQGYTEDEWLGFFWGSPGDRRAATDRSHFLFAHRPSVPQYQLAHPWQPSIIIKHERFWTVEKELQTALTGQTTHQDLVRKRLAYGTFCSIGLACGAACFITFCLRRILFQKILSRSRFFPVSYSVYRFLGSDNIRIQISDHNDAICTKQQWRNRHTANSLSNQTSWDTNCNSQI